MGIYWITSRKLVMDISAGRNKMRKRETVVIGIRLPAELLAAVRKIANSEYTTVAAVVRKAVAEYVKSKQKED